MEVRDIPKTLKSFRTILIRKNEKIEPTQETSDQYLWDQTYKDFLVRFYIKE